MAKSAPKSQDLNINLLQKEEVGGTAGEIIKWVLTVGRYLVILTEIVALVTFGLGIKFSADKNDLKQKVAVAKSVVDSKANCDNSDLEKFCEDRFRSIQNAVTQISQQRSSQFRESGVLKELLSRLPNGVHLNNLNLDGTKLSLSGYFPNAVDLQTLIISLSNSEKIIDLDIQELNSPSTTEPNFTFKAVANVDASKFIETKAAAK